MILNLTQHKLTRAQVKEGVVDLPPSERAKLLRELLLLELPTPLEINMRARRIAELADDFLNRVGGGRRVMIDGAPVLMPALTGYLQRLRLIPVMAFSRRKLVESTTPDGAIVFTAVFQHLGFVEVPDIPR